MRPAITIALAMSALLAPACSRSTTQSTPAPAQPRTAPARTARPAPVPAAPAMDAAAVAEDVIARTNAERRAAKLPPLTRSMNLMRAAEIQAAQMARANQLEHDLPGAAYPTLASRLASVSYPVRSAGENIGEGYRTPAAALAGWMASSGHRANILSATFTEMGAAMTTSSNGAVYWVQVFGRPR